MNGFIAKEINNLKKLRLVAVGFLVLVNCSIIGFFVYLFYQAFSSREIKENFFTYIFPTIFYLQLVLALSFLPVIIIIYRRFKSIIKELTELNEEFVLHYQNYTRFVHRFFSTIPLYLISQKGLVVFMNFKTQLLPPNSINFIKIKRVNIGRFKRCTIYLYQYQTLKSKIIYHTSDPKETEYLKQNIHLINNNVRIED